MNRRWQRLIAHGHEMRRQVVNSAQKDGKVIKLVINTAVKCGDQNDDQSAQHA
jgi:hypothetical protein